MLDDDELHDGELHDGEFHDDEQDDEFDVASLDDARLDEAPEAPARPIDRFRSTAAGTVMAAGLFGLAEALEGPRDQGVEIVIDYAGDPPFSDRFLMRLDPENPSDSIVVVQSDPSRYDGHLKRPETSD